MATAAALLLRNCCYSVDAVSVNFLNQIERHNRGSNAAATVTYFINKIYRYRGLVQSAAVMQLKLTSECHLYSAALLV